ncbi:hypothetical protein IV203_013979 [Nitzschia inconspicua]|uniref:Uncharacterized protein n=1 Tax=Nitzschia inconspicua TaxID=303405 RepID=A0A9K3M670_9STRA|nr:hypothetical protein IV203_014240 [Nitzschia inconspicua]KAG7374884.1 hypothetical protein IV203_013979 [Nitzschia inconspicua]
MRKLSLGELSLDGARRGDANVAFRRSVAMASAALTKTLGDHAGSAVPKVAAGFLEELVLALMEGSLISKQHVPTFQAGRRHQTRPTNQ